MKFIFYGLFPAHKLEMVSNGDKHRFLQAHKTFKGYTDSKLLLCHVQKFKMVEGEKVSVTLPKNWKR